MSILPTWQSQVILSEIITMTPSHTSSKVINYSYGNTEGILNFLLRFTLDLDFKNIGSFIQYASVYTVKTSKSRVLNWSHSGTHIFPWSLSGAPLL